MQIHELNNYNGNLDSSAYLAVDNGSDTGKISTTELLADTNAAVSQLDTVLNGRIDNIVAGGEAPSTSEIVDARYGADGVTYPSLGAAIRYQVTDLKSDLTKLATFGNIYLAETKLDIDTEISLIGDSLKPFMPYGDYDGYGYFDSDTYKFANSSSYYTLYYKMNTDGVIYTTNNAYIYSVYNITQKVYLNSANLPTQENQMSFIKEDTVAITITTTKSGTYLRRFSIKYTFNDGMAIINDNVSKSVLEYGNIPLKTVSKTENNISVNIGKWKFDVNRYDLDNIREHCWRTNACYVADSNGQYQKIWLDSDSDGVVKVSGEDDFIGGYHGDETQTSIQIFIDGVEYDTNSTFENKKFNEIVMIFESDVYHCNTSSTPNIVAFKRNKIIKFNDDGYTVENYWLAQEEITLEVAYIGMLSVDKFLSDGTQLTTGFYTDADYKFSNSGETVEYSNKRNCVEFITRFGNIGLKVSEYEPTENYSAWVTYYKSGNRNKAYFAPLRKSSQGHLNVGDVIRGKAITFFN